MSYREQSTVKDTRKKSTLREFDNKNGTRENFQDFLHNVDYEYMRKQFDAVKEKVRLHNMNNAILNPGLGHGYALIKSGRMVKLDKNIKSLHGPFGGLPILGRAVLSAVAIGAAVSFVKWGTTDDTWKRSCGFTESTAMGRETIIRSINDNELMKKFGMMLNHVKDQISSLHSDLTGFWKNVVFAGKKNKSE